MKMSTFRDTKKSLRTVTKKIFGQNNCTSKEVTPVWSVKADRAPHGGMCHMGARRSCQTLSDSTATFYFHIWKFELKRDKI